MVDLEWTENQLQFAKSESERGWNVLGIDYNKLPNTLSHFKIYLTWLSIIENDTPRFFYKVKTCFSLSCEIIRNNFVKCLKMMIKVTKSRTYTACTPKKWASCSRLMKTRLTLFCRQLCSMLFTILNNIVDSKLARNQV